MDKIIVHTMNDCHLCRRVKRMFKEFNVEYELILDEPHLDEPYPIIYINNKKFSIEQICDKLFDGTLGS